jgi:guanylate kinase
VTNHAVLLYGPPGAGKDTVTAALSRLCPAYRLAQRLKAGPGRTTGYRMTNIGTIDTLTADGQILWRNDRYGATYATDRPHIDAMLRANLIPVLHLGQPDAITAITTAASDITWTVVELWCPRDVAASRIAGRETGDTESRLAAYDNTARLPGAALRVLTSDNTPDEAAALIDRVVRTHS